MLIVIPAIGLFGVLFALVTFKFLLRKPEGLDKMREISREVQEGAMVFLKREYVIISIFMVIMFAIISKFLSLETGFAYVSGAFCSMFAGFVGMQASTRASARTCEAARTKGIPEALGVAFKGGSIMGITVAALGVV
ncbi:MAG: sodium/proton-translocating pyrophosphatase, partial [Candidatus Omnitrophica bacterium]|nr:sodium/proton-translocating pyrophosphatase [Candidatus Omnitrophota bacterium]